MVGLYKKKFNPNKVYAADFDTKIKAKCKMKVDEFKIIDFENSKMILEVILWI